MFRETMSTYFYDHMESTNTLCKNNGKFLMLNLQMYVLTARH
jgi:hypothetical protein